MDSEVPDLAGFKKSASTIGCVIGSGLHKIGKLLRFFW
jgi:hypothetical protein